jgi:glutathione S-transferase
MNPPTAPSRPLLYSYRRCPYAMRARMALLLAGCAFDVFEVSLRDKPQALRSLSPKATVPVLHLADGQVLDQSWDIMRWALSPAAMAAWWEPAQATDNLALLACNDGDFKRHLDAYKYPERSAAAVGPAAAKANTRADRRAQAVAALIRPLEARLVHHPFLGGAQACATDLALFPFIRQFAAVEPDWFAAQDLPAVQAWLAHWVGSHLFEVCMTRLPAQAIAAFPALTA